MALNHPQLSLLRNLVMLLARSLTVLQVLTASAPLRVYLIVF
jgi:hypothetical protein